MTSPTTLNPTSADFSELLRIAYDVPVRITFDDGSGNTTTVSRTYDLWSVANSSQKSDVQSIADLVKSYLDTQILG